MNAWFSAQPPQAAPIDGIAERTGPSASEQPACVSAATPQPSTAQWQLALTRSIEPNIDDSAAFSGAPVHVACCGCVRLKHLRRSRTVAVPVGLPTRQLRQPLLSARAA
eukprot:COSAG01_NODE_736_length_13947_cov_174.337449_18_plen_109_part_00